MKLQFRVIASQITFFFTGKPLAHNFSARSSAPFLRTLVHWILHLIVAVTFRSCSPFVALLNSEDTSINLVYLSDRGAANFISWWEFSIHLSV